MRTSLARIVRRRKMAQTYGLLSILLPEIDLTTARRERIARFPGKLRNSDQEFRYLSQNEAGFCESDSQSIHHPSLAIVAGDLICSSQSNENF